MKNKKTGKSNESQSSYQYIMRHLDIYGQPLQWYIGNDKTYNTVVGGCRTFFVIGAALIFLIYSIYQLFTSREGSYVFYDIVFSEIEDEYIYYYQDFEIFFFFQTSGHQMMEMDADILKAVIKQTKASEDSSSSESTESTRLRNLKKKKKRKLQMDNTNNGEPTNTDTTSNNENTSPENENNNGENNENTNGENNNSSSEDDVIAKYTFYECDNKYFTDELGFSNTVSEGLSSTYCLNRSSLEDEELNFTLSPLNPLGISSNPLTFTFEQNCQSSECTSQENQQYQRIIKQIKTLKIFIKTRITNPLNLENPIQTQVNTFTLTQSHLGSTIYFKKYLIETDSSLIPYIVGTKKEEFLSFDYEKENTESDANSFYLSFALSNTKSYLTRNYEKLDNALANFLAVFNALEIAGKILTFFFSSFSNEIFIFNYILKDRLYKKSSLVLGKNPPKKIQYNKIDNYTLGNDNLKSNNDDEDIQNVNNNNNNNILVINKNKINQNTNLKKNDDLIISKHFKEDSDVSSINKINNNNNNNNNNKNNDNNNNNNIYKNNNNKIKSFETSENLMSNNQFIEKKKIIKNDKNNNNEEEKINLNFLKNFWSVVLMSFDKKESKYKDIEDALEKIRLIQNIFDSSIYINMVFDLIRLKKVIFTETQEKLFNSIHFTAEEIDEYITKYQNNQEFLTKEEIIKIKINLSNEKQNKLTQNLLEKLNIQLK